MKIWARWPYIHLSVVFPSRMPAGPHFVTQPILLSENIPNIWHKSSTKHKEVRPDWNDKNDNANYAPSYHMEGFTNGSGCHFLKKYSIKCEKRFRLANCFILVLKKRHNVSHYIYYLATDNIHIVLENDNTVLIKGLKKVVNVKFSRNTHLIETSYDRLKIREITFQQYRKILLKQEFSDGLNIHEHKRYYYTFDNSLLFTESIQNTTQIFSTLNHNVRFLPCQHRGVGIMQCINAR